MEEAVDKVIEALKPFAEKLGEGAEFLWGVTVREVIMDGVVNLIVALVLFALAFILTVLAPRYIRKARDAAVKHHKELWDDWKSNIKTLIPDDPQTGWTWTYDVERKMPTRVNPHDYQIGIWVCWGIAAVLNVIAVGYIVMAIRYFVNPHWYAIQKLMEQVQNF